MYGVRPYNDVDDQFSLAIAIRDNGLVPHITTDLESSIAEMMKRCWQQDPQNRPTFSDICSSFEKTWGTLE